MVELEPGICHSHNVVDIENIKYEIMYTVSIIAYIHMIYYNIILYIYIYIIKIIILYYILSLSLSNLI